MHSVGPNKKHYEVWQPERRTGKDGKTGVHCVQPSTSGKDVETEDDYN